MDAFEETGLVEWTGSQCIFCPQLFTQGGLPAHGLAYF
jgi:hypothetical protein